MVNVSPPSSFAIDVPDTLLARARRGEAAAFEQLYRRFERPVYTLALRLTGQREEAQDILQDRIGPDRKCAPGKDDCGMPALFRAFRWQGLNLASIDSSLGRYFGTEKGVLVISNGPELKGLQSGDVIRRVAGSEVESPRDVMRSLRETKSGTQLKLDVLRDRKLVPVTITVPDSEPLPFMSPSPPPAPPQPPTSPVPPAPPALPDELANQALR